MFHLLCETLIERGVLRRGELKARFDASEKSEFAADFLLYLASLGLKVEGGGPQP